MATEDVEQRGESQARDRREEEREYQGLLLYFYLESGSRQQVDRHPQKRNTTCTRCDGHMFTRTITVVAHA